jgi:hypothetical protein
MVRVFITPKLNNFKKPWTFQEQRRMMVELDKFVTQCELKQKFN